MQNLSNLETAAKISRKVPSNRNQVAQAKFTLLEDGTRTSTSGPIGTSL